MYTTIIFGVLLCNEFPTMLLALTNDGQIQKEELANYVSNENGQGKRDHEHGHGPPAHDHKHDHDLSGRCKKHGGTEHTHNQMMGGEEVADMETTTPNGCRCTSLCGASVGRDSYQYDWCTTNEGCGKNDTSGYYDTCQYLDHSKPDNTALCWHEKQTQMWTDILSNRSSAPLQNPAGVVTESVQTSFRNEWDVLPVGRIKYIHAKGVVCPFVVNIENSPFTGIFKNGMANGLTRLTPTFLSANAGMTPGGGLKFFRSGRSSANFVVMNKLSPIADNNYNFFAVPLSNHIPEDTPARLEPLAKKFCQAQSCPTKVGLSDVCKYDQDGNKAENVVFPFKVSLVPTGEIKFEEEYSGEEAFLQQFEDLDVGTTLYTLKGHQTPDDTEGITIGNVVTTEKCVTSLYGDLKLFFKHQLINEDKYLKPEWADGYDIGCTPYCASSP